MSQQAPRELPPLPPWAEKLTRVLDDFIRIPGTRIGVGLDALIGLVFPGAGDMLTGVGSAALFWLALKSGVPLVIVLRMIVNVGIDALLGAVPLLGDLFDIGWKANRRNLELLQRHRGQSTRAVSGGDYLVVGLAMLALLCVLVAPVVLVAIVVDAFGR